jgi:hypothetical protein
MIGKRIRRQWRTYLWRLRGRRTWVLDFFVIFPFLWVLFVQGRV